ncbi:MAG: hypothetical protein ABEI77_07285 [Halorientalis sp.]
MDSEALLAPFDDDLFESVAGRHEVTVEELRSLAGRQQQQVRDNPGVEDIVYEWRTQFHEQPVVHQTDDAYYLRLRRHVWDEFADALDIAETDLYALLDLHTDQTRRVTGAETTDTERLMVLSRA